MEDLTNTEVKKAIKILQESGLETTKDFFEGALERYKSPIAEAIIQELGNEKSWRKATWFSLFCLAKSPDGIVLVAASKLAKQIAALDSSDGSKDASYKPTEVLTFWESCRRSLERTASKNWDKIHKTLWVKSLMDIYSILDQNPQATPTGKDGFLDQACADIVQRFTPELTSEQRVAVYQFRMMNQLPYSSSMAGQINLLFVTKEGVEQIGEILDGMENQEFATRISNRMVAWQKRVGLWGGHTEWYEAALQRAREKELLKGNSNGASTEISVAQ